MKYYSVKYATSLDELHGVKLIYRLNKRELGFLPDGAFQERLQRRQILVAVQDEKIVGYVLFAVNQKTEVRIAHMAIASDHRGNGISRKLIDKIRGDFATHSRIRLNCRSDFSASNVWPRLGFVAGKRIPGKKLGGSELIVFTLQLNDMPLFELQSDVFELPVIACDANVCIDILYADRPRHENACGLLADWLIDEASLAVTEEILNDLNRQNEPLRSEMLSSIRLSWSMIVPDNSCIDQHVQSIRSILGDPKDPSGVSDQRHLAIAASRNVIAFATYDGELLRAAPEILALTGLRVQRPSEIISEIDSAIRSSIYQYRELRNSGVERYRVKSIKEIELSEFVNSRVGETQRILYGRIDGALSLPDRFEINQIRDAAGRSLAIILLESLGPHLNIIHNFRVANRLAGTRLGNVIAELIAHQPIGTTVSSEYRMIKMANTVAEPSLALACLRRGFQCFGGDYFKLHLPGFWQKTQLEVTINKLVTEYGLPASIRSTILKLIENACLGSIASIRQLEALIHPGKISFGELPSYIVPIQPEWAQELFEFRIWNRPLLPMDTKLVINPDSVYYKRPKNSPNGDVARILWYVSGDKNRGGGCIRACSVMTNGVTGTVKDLYREYQRLGVFEWRHLIHHFEKPDADAFAMEFTNTELLPNTISLDEVNAILIENGMKRQQFVSAVKISQIAFEAIYKLALK